MTIAQTPTEWLELQFSRQGGRTRMVTFRITYGTSATETVEASGYRDIGDGTWIEFVDGVGTQILRVKARGIDRIELVRP
jgi:hypothetical protein